MKRTQVSPGADLLWKAPRQWLLFPFDSDLSLNLLTFLFGRSVWLIGGLILPLLEMDVWSKYGSLYLDIQPHHVARGKILTSGLQKKYLEQVSPVLENFRPLLKNRMINWPYPL